jgi:hypothetical protein
MTNYYPSTGTTAQSPTTVGLDLPSTILGVPTWLWVVGGAVFFLIHKGKI